MGKNNKKESLDTFFEAHYSKLLNHARYICPQHAEDILHEVYLICVERGYTSINYALFLQLVREAIRNQKISEVSIGEDHLIITPNREKTRERLAVHHATAQKEEVTERQEKVEKAIRKLAEEHANGRQRCIFLAETEVSR